MTTLKFGSDQSYEVTPTDRLWLLRAVQAEGPVQLDVARALVNLFCFLRSTGDLRTLTQVVRAYAQPVNPRWFQSGDLLKKAAAAAQSPEEVAALLEKARNRELVHAARQTFTANVQHAVDVALSRSFSSDVTDYAASYVDATGKGYTPRSEPKLGRNRLWTRAVGWAGYFVDGASGGGGAIVALLLIAVAAFALRKA